MYNSHGVLMSFFSEPLELSFIEEVKKGASEERDPRHGDVSTPHWVVHLVPSLEWVQSRGLHRQ